jgi:hypothetical protein
LYFIDLKNIIAVPEESMARGLITVLILERTVIG